MAKKLPTLEIHAEDWNHALHISKNGHTSSVSFWWLLFTCQDYEIHPIIYFLKDYDKEYPVFRETLEKSNWTVKSHGVHHYYDEKADRSPYFNQEGIPFPPSGGFFFRCAPMSYLKWAIKKSGVFWIHPHDLDEEHPKIMGNMFLNWKRHIGLKRAKAKLEKLLQEVKFE